MRQQFPNAPQSIACRVCKNMFPNPMLHGAKGVSVVCRKCKHGMMSAKTVRSLTKPKPQRKSESSVKVTSAATPEPVPTPPQVSGDSGFKSLNDYRLSLLKAPSKGVTQ